MGARGRPEPEEARMSYEVRQLSFAEVFDRGFALLRNQFPLLVGISAAVYVPYSLALAVGAAIDNIILIIVSILAFIAAVPIMQAALTVATTETYLGRQTSIGEAYRTAVRLALPIMGTYLLMTLLLIPAFLLLVLPGIYFMVCWMLVGPIMIVEQRFGMSGLRRSRELVRFRWARGAAVMLLAALMIGVISGALGFLWSFIPFVGPVLNGLTQAVTSAFSLVVITVLYFDLRCRHEDFDLHFLAEQVRAASTVAGTP